MHKIGYGICLLLLCTYGFNANAALSAPQKQKYFFSAEGLAILPDHDQVIQTFATESTIRHQRISHQFSYALSGGINIKPELFVRLSLRHLAPADLFHLKVTVPGSSIVDSDFKDQWNFNIWHLDIGRYASLSQHINLSAYIGIAYINAYIEASTDKPVHITSAGYYIQKEKLSIHGIGPKLGFATQYLISKRFSFRGGFNTTFYYAEFKDYQARSKLSSGPPEPLKLTWDNYRTTIPMIDAFVSADMAVTPNFDVQLGMRASHSFNFDTNAFITMYKNAYIANDIGWFGPYISISAHF